MRKSSEKRAWPVAWGRVAWKWAPANRRFSPRRQAKPIEVVAIPRSPVLPMVPFTYDICLGVRPGNERLRDEINAAIERRQGEIDRILDQYHVPRPAR